MNVPMQTPTEPSGVAVIRAIAALLDQAASAGIRAQRETGAAPEAALATAKVRQRDRGLSPSTDVTGAVVWFRRFDELW